MNEIYFMSDKRVLQQIAAFPLLPEGYIERLENLLARPGRTPAELKLAVSGLEAEWRKVVALTGGSYRPQFNLQKGK